MKTAIIAIIIFGALVIVHELGHFLVAKAFNTRIYEFSIGMGPGLIKKKRGETVYALRAIPFGGYVRFDAFKKPEYKNLEEEQADTKEYEEEYDDERSLMNKKSWQRLLILVAGSFMNVVMAIVIFIGVFTYVGQPTTVLGEVSTNMPAYSAGLRVGDEILSINSQKVKTWDDIVQFVVTSKNEKIDVEVKKPTGETKKLSIATVKENDSPKIGIKPQFSHGLISGIKGAFITTGAFTISMIQTVVQLFTGKANVNDFAGPVGIVTIVDKAVEVGVQYVLNLTAMLSLNLAVINLLPLPALDGGRIVITLMEIVTGGKKIPQKVETIIHITGFVILLSFMLFLTFKDVGRLIGG